VARLLGVRLLKVDGVVHLAPARLEPAGVAGTRPVASSPAGAGPARGGGLARAAQMVEDGDRRLH
jgi:hypothetical protein